MTFARNPSRLFGVVAAAEMVTWTLLLAGMLGKYVLGAGDLGVRIGGGLHGFVFLSYCLVSVLVAVDQRWRASPLLLGLASAVVPYATVPFERAARRRGLLGQRWRLRGSTPSSPRERIVAVALHRPVGAAAAAVVVVALVFSGLLALGPPTQWFS